MVESTGTVRIRIDADTQEMQKLQKQLKESEAEIERLNAEMQKLSNSSSSAAKMQEKNAQAAQATAQATNRVTEMTERQTKAMTSQQAQYDALQRKAQNLRTEMAKIGTVKTPTAEYAALNEELSSIQQKMAALEESKMGVERGAYADEVNEQLAEMSARCDEITETMRQMESAGTDSIEAIADPAKYQKLNDQLVETNNKMTAMKAQMSSTGDTSSAAAKDFADMAGSFVRSSNSASGSIRTMNSALSTTAGTIGLAAGVAVMAVTAIADGLKDCAETGAEFLEEIVSGAVDIAEAIGEKVNEALEDAQDLADGAASAIGELAKAISSAADKLISSGISELLETFSTQLDLAQEASILAGDAMNQFEDDVAGVGNALVSAFTPIIETLIPYINMLSEALAEVVNLIGMLFAGLTGSTTYTKLTKITDEAEDTADAVEEAGNNLADFDELDVLQEDTTSSVSAATDGLSYTMEEVDLPSWALGLGSLLDEVNGILDDLDAWQISFDLAQTVADWLEGIDWESIQLTASKVGEELADFFNGIFDNLSLAEELGNFLAQCINTAIITFKDFVDNFDWTQLGVWLGTAINSFVDGIDWELLGQTVAAFFNGLIDTLIAGIETTDWANIGTQIGAAINAAIGEFDWEDLGRLVADTINAAFLLIKTTIEETDWYVLFYGIGTSIYTAITETDWVGIAETLLAGVNGITDAIGGFADSIDWVGVADSILAGIQVLVDGQYIDENGELHDIWAENGEAVGTLITDFVDGVLEFVQGLPYEEIGTAICDWLSNAIAGIDWEDAGTTIYTFVEGLITTITTMLNDEETKEEIITALGDLISGLNAADLISDITDLVYDIFDYLYDVLEESDAMGEIGELMMNLMGLGFSVKFNTWALKFLALWETLGSQVSTAWNNLWSNVGSALDTNKQGIIDAMETVRSTIYDKLSGISTFWAEIFDGMFEAAETVWTNVRTTIDNAITGIQTVIETVLSAMSGSWEDAWNGLVDIVKGVVNTLVGVINTLISGVETMINSVINAVNSISFDLPEVLGGGHVGFNLSTVSLPRVPELADGAVIRGGDPFAAILGDQSTGQTNIEAPLDTIVEAFKTALDEEGYSSNSGINTVYLTVDGAELAKATLDDYISEISRRGMTVTAAVQGA